MPKFECGEAVYWKSSNTTKKGYVEAIVPAGKTPSEIGFPKAGGGGICRDHESYVLRGRKLNSRGAEYGSKGWYWPHVSLLKVPPA